MKAKRDHAAAVEQAREQRQASYLAQENTIIVNVKQAAKTASEGDIDGAVKQLAVAEQKWGEMASSANSAKDTAKAEYAMNRQAAMKKTLAELEAYRKQAAVFAERADQLAAKVATLERQRDALNGKVKQRVLDLAAPGVKAEGGGPAGEPEQPLGPEGEAGPEPSPQEPGA